MKKLFTLIVVSFTLSTIVLAAPTETNPKAAEQENGSTVKEFSPKVTPGNTAPAEPESVSGGKKPAKVTPENIAHAEQASNGGIDELKKDIIKFSNDFLIMDAYIRQAYKTHLNEERATEQKSTKNDDEFYQWGAANEQNASPIVAEVRKLVDECRDKKPQTSGWGYTRDYAVIKAGRKLKELAIDNKKKIDNWIGKLKDNPANESKVKILRIFWKLFDMTRAKLKWQVYYMGHSSLHTSSDIVHALLDALVMNTKYHLTLNCIKLWAKNVDGQKIDVSNVDELLKKLEESDGEIKKIDAEITTENQAPVGSTKAD